MPNHPNRAAAEGVSADIRERERLFEAAFGEVGDPIGNLADLARQLFWVQASLSIA